MLADEQEAPAVDQGTYELLQGRLLARARALRAKTEALNLNRIEVFGSTELKLASSERIRTENNCVPRDILAVGDCLLFGYQVFLGLRSETRVEDVLALNQFRVDGEGDDRRFILEPLPPGDAENFLADAIFVRDFGETYRYYKETRLQQLRRTHDKLLAVFQTGAGVADIKVFRWAIDRDGRVRYVDNRGERDHVFPPSHDFESTETGREDYVLGRHPHVSILERISEVMAALNRARALLEGRRKTLLSKEGAAEFAAQFKLLDQHVAGALGLAETPEACAERGADGHSLEALEGAGEGDALEEIVRVAAERYEEGYERGVHDHDVHDHDVHDHDAARPSATQSPPSTLARQRAPRRARRLRRSASPSRWATTFCSISTISSIRARSCCRNSSPCATRSGAWRVSGGAERAPTTCVASVLPSSCFRAATET